MVRVHAKRERVNIAVIHAAVSVISVDGSEENARSSISSSGAAANLCGVPPPRDVGNAIVRSVHKSLQKLGGLRYAATDAIELSEAAWQSCDPVVPAVGSLAREDRAEDRGRDGEDGAGLEKDASVTPVAVHGQSLRLAVKLEKGRGTTEANVFRSACACVGNIVVYVAPSKQRKRQQKGTAVSVKCRVALRVIRC